MYIHFEALELIDPKNYWVLDRFLSAYYASLVRFLVSAFRVGANRESHHVSDGVNSRSIMIPNLHDRLSEVLSHFLPPIPS